MNFRPLPLLLSLLLAACGGAADNGDRSNTPVKAEAPAGAIAGSDAPRDCFWATASDANAANVLYPDQAAVYWVASFTIPAGGELRLNGRYPHARYMSFNLYNPRLEPLDALADVEIAADGGAPNPFAAGALRGTEAPYSVRIIAAAKPDDPAQREANTLYSDQVVGSQRVASPNAIVIYRVYVSDQGRDRSGGVGLPAVTVVAADGTTLGGTAACSALETNVPPQLTDTLNGLAPPADPLPSTAAFMHPQWLKFFDLASSQANRFNATPLAGPLHSAVPPSTSNSGGFASNAHNNYIYATFSQEFGAVGAFAAEFPQTPHTYLGQPRMEDGEMRYWSLCTNDANSQRYYDCVFDEEVARDRSGRAVIAISRPDDRPANARSECGVTWIAWGPTSQTLLIYRHMLPKPASAFPYAVQYIPGPAGAHEEEVMGRYFPYGTHLGKADFEALGCPVSPDSLPRISSQPAAG